MASRGGVGLEIDVTLVPQREDAMKPFEIMVSESQERMLAVVTPENLGEVQDICERWGLPATVIGQVTDTGRFVIREGDEVVGDMPAATLAHDAPIYDPPAERPAYLDELQRFDPLAELDHPEGVEMLTATLFDLLASPNICSRRWIWEQYDHQVMLNTVVLPGSDAAVLRIGMPGRGEVTERAIAASSDCNGRYCYLDPYTGAQIAVAEAARNVACAGGRPAAITDCLNFGSPEKPEVFWTFPSPSVAWPTRAARGRCRSSPATSPSTTSRSASRSIPRPPLVSSASSRTSRITPRSASRRSAT
jgi:phosphoribosylformylglycinamidine synthase subunit PurL